MTNIVAADNQLIARFEACVASLEALSNQLIAHINQINRSLMKLRNAYHSWPSNLINDMEVQPQPSNFYAFRDTNIPP